MRGLRQMDVVDVAARSGQRLKRGPVCCVVGHLKGTLRRAKNPVKRDAIERAGRAEVDIDPLLVQVRAGCVSIQLFSTRLRSAQPGAGEIVRTSDVDLAVAIEECQLIHVPEQRASAVKLHSIETMAHGFGQADGGRDLITQRARHAFSVSNFLPCPAIVGALEPAVPHLHVSGPRSAGGVDIQPVNFWSLLATTQFDLYPGVLAREVDRSRQVVVEGQFAADLRQRSISACGNYHSSRYCRRLDAVGDELRGQVEIVTAGVPRRPMQSEVAIRGRIDLHRWSEIPLRISRIHANTARVLLGGEAEHSDKADRQ